jgi:hypothetical protein
VYGRPRPKNIDRFNEKCNMVTRPDKAFKSICDLMAFRVEVPVDEITDVTNYITDVFSKNGGITSLKTKNSTIIQSIYGYLPNIGIMEFQVGHAFACYTFAVDSKIRHNKQYNLPCDIVDLCTDEFFQNIQEKILGMNPNYNIYDNLNKIYGNKPIPSELLEILATIND